MNKCVYHLSNLNYSLNHTTLADVPRHFCREWCKVRKAVSRIRQSSIAGQPNAAGLNECPPGRHGVQDGTI